MAVVVQELLTKLGFQVDRKGIDKGQDTLKKFKGFVAKLAIGAAVVGIGTSAIKSAADLEMMNAQFTTMLGSAEAARDMMEQLNKFSVKTPFEPAQVASASQTLLQFGVASEDIMGTLQTLGDVSGGNSERFKMMALAYGQMQSAGRLMGQDLLQMINAGFNPLKVISEQTGQSMFDLKKQMEKGAISAKAVGLAFKAASSEGGMFYKGMERGSKTFWGLWSTMMGAIKLKMAEAIGPILPMLKGVLKAIAAVDLTPIVSGFSDIVGLQDDFGGAIAGVIQSMVNLFAMALRILAVLDDWAPTLATIVGWIEAMGDALEWMYPLLLLVYGPRMKAMILGSAFAQRISAAATMFMQRASLAAGAAAGYQATASSVLTASLYSVRTAAVSAGAAMKTAFAGLLNPLTLALVGLVSLWMAANKIKKDFRDELQKTKDKSEEEDVLNGTARFQEKLAQKEVKATKTKINAMKAAMAEGKAIDSTELRSLVARRNAAQDILKGIGDARSRVFGDEADRFANEATSLAGGATASLRKKSGGDSKNMTINNELRMEITGASGSTGIKAKDLPALAEQAVKAQFNIQLKKVMVGAY